MKFLKRKKAQNEHWHARKMNLDTDFIPFTNINSKWIINLNLKCKTIKLLGGNTGENVDGLVCGIFRQDIKDMIMEEITSKLDFINIRTFCSVKDNIRRISRHTTD